MLKKLVLMIVLFGAVSQQQAGPISVISNVHDWGFKQWYGYREISVKHYPKTVAYLDGLRTKYPRAFKDIEFVMSHYLSYGPAKACMSTVFIADKFVKKIEADDAQTKDAMELVLLHEAGHVRHYDIMKFYVFLGICVFSSQKIMEAIKNESPTRTVTREQEVGGELLFMTLPLILFSRWYMEPRADDYACEQCDNPQAFKDGVTFFEKLGTLGWFADMMHPTVASRIEKIKEAFKKKFGQEMPE